MTTSEKGKQVKGNSGRSKASRASSTGLKRAGQKSDPKLHVRKRVAGGASGTMIGAAVAGPIGAVIGGILGTAIGAAAEGVSVRAVSKSPSRSRKGTGARKATTKSAGSRRTASS